MTITSTEWMPLREAAKTLCCDDETVRAWIKRGVLNARRQPNQRIEVLRADIERALGRDIDQGQTGTLIRDTN